LLWGRSQRRQAAFIFGDAPRGRQAAFFMLWGCSQTCFRDAPEGDIGEKNGAKKNGARPHFLLLCPQVENVLFLTKWGLSPFIRGNKDACHVGA